MKSNNERSLEVKLKMNLLFRLELRIASNSSMPFIHRVIPKINHSVIDISVLPGEQNDFENEYLTFQTKLFEYSPVLASKVVSKFMNEHRSFVPVPISLPYPFDSIIFQDFDLEVREGEWWIGLELVE